ncbi:MAG: signal peptide peptidase SppA [Desulfovibrio sp.]
MPRIRSLCLPPVLSILPLLLVVSALAACSPRVTLFPDGSEPLLEQVLEGSASEKVLLVEASGTVSDQPRQGLLGSRPSMVQEIVSRLKLAEKDDAVRAVILKINSPGGGVTASDILHHELTEFRKRTTKPVVALFMDVAASGGYYIALPADRIVCHPTSVTGSVGAVVFLPRVDGLLEKLGVNVDVAKSGRNKDMGSPFRQSTEEERALAQTLINEMGGRFQRLVREARHLDDAAMETVATARIFTAQQALELGLVDQLGYLQDAFAEARALAELPDDARLVAYRGAPQANDTPYNAASGPSPDRPALVDAGVLGAALEQSFPRQAGVYYLWLPNGD